jgi:hypothetical protein
VSPYNTMLGLSNYEGLVFAIFISVVHNSLSLSLTKMSCSCQLFEMMSCSCQLFEMR